jgi:hypothetical protein
MWLKITIWVRIYDELMPFPVDFSEDPARATCTVPWRKRDETRLQVVTRNGPAGPEPVDTQTPVASSSLGPPLLSSPFSSSSLPLPRRRRELGRRRRSPLQEGLYPGSKGLPEASSFHKVRSGQGLPFFLPRPPPTVLFSRLLFLLLLCFLAFP